MKTVKVEALFLDPNHQPDVNELTAMLNGKCPVCDDNNVCLETCDEWTDFYCYNNCGLRIHAEVIEIITGQKVEKTTDVIFNILNSVGKKCAIE